MKTRYILSIFLLGLIVIQGCKKDEDSVFDNSTTSAKDNGAAENVFADIKRVVEEAADDEGQSNRLARGGNYSFGNCATVSINPAWVDTTWPKVMEIDFGPNNCMVFMA